MALQYLRKAVSNENAQFRAGQFEAIESIVRRREKALIVQRTGWGKSIVYFISTKLLREQGAGPTLLVSPLLSLMRNQISAAKELGLVADSINSENREDWEIIQEKLKRKQTDILLVSPERLANREFIEAVLGEIVKNTGLMVVDEAHCISDWGHDFRPDYMRIARIVRGLPKNTPVIATTATANNRVVCDVKCQLGASINVVRGPLVRHSLRLQNINMPNAAERMAWLAEHLPSLSGSGIVYTLTTIDADRLAKWFQANSIDFHAYHSGVLPEKKTELEQKLLGNEIKGLVATVALGMGFDKPDLGFVIHYQRPASVVHYYQQVGRAGRAVENAYGILFSGSEDDDITQYFINTALPPDDQLDKIVSVLEKNPDGLSINQILRHVNITQTKLEQALKILFLGNPSPITKIGNKYVRTATRFETDKKKSEMLKNMKKEEQQRMQDYMLTKTCLMEFLSKELDDPHAGPCGKCANCSESPPLSLSYSNALAAQALDFLRKSDIVIEPRKKWPSGIEDTQYRGHIPKEYWMSEGRALCRWGDVGWGELVKQGKQKDKRFSQELVEAVLELIEKRWRPDPQLKWVTCVPSNSHGELVPDFARRLAEKMDLPFINCISKEWGISPQKTMMNSLQQLNNIKGAFSVDIKRLIKAPVLLVDDMVDSRWTFALVTYMLRRHTDSEVFPLALAKT